jgi:hypothetical protein
LHQSFCKIVHHVANNFRAIIKLKPMFLETPTCPWKLLQCYSSNFNCQINYEKYKMNFKDSQNNCGTVLMCVGFIGPSPTIILPQQVTQINSPFSLLLTKRKNSKTIKGKRPQKLTCALAQLARPSPPHLSPSSVAVSTARAPDAADGHAPAIQAFPGEDKDAPSASPLPAKP